MAAAERQFVAMQMRLVQSDSALAEQRRVVEDKDHQLRESQGLSICQSINKRRLQKDTNIRCLTLSNSPRTHL